jgi:hypothetical protein
MKETEEEKPATGQSVPWSLMISQLAVMRDMTAVPGRKGQNVKSKYLIF